MARKVLMHLCLLAVVLAGAAGAQRSSISENLIDWIKVVPPTVGTEGWSAARSSEYEWQVAIKDGRPTARRRNVKAEDAAAVPPAMKRAHHEHDEPGTMLSCPVNDGWLVAFDAGDFGSLWWYGADGRQRYRISDVQVRQFLPSRHGLFALERGDRGRSAHGRVLQIQQDAQKQWYALPYFDLGHAPDAGLIDRDGSVIVSTTEDLVKIRPDKTEEILLPKVFWQELAPRSMAISPEGDIYLGMHFGVAIVYQRNHVYAADWLVPNREFLRAKAGN